MRFHHVFAVTMFVFAGALSWQWPAGRVPDAVRVYAATAAETGELDARLADVLAAAGFTGAVERTLELRLGRSLDPALVVKVPSSLVS